MLTSSQTFRQYIFHLTNMELGKGTYGMVTVDKNNPNLAVKKFTVTAELVQEASMLLYLRGIPNVLKINSFNIGNKTITSEKWDTTLKETIYKSKLSRSQKLTIFEDLLTGLAHMHSLDVVHGDFKLSNILVNYNPHANHNEMYRACICDVGLTSLSQYAKVTRTADPYRPAKPKRHYSHDMFGLCVSMCKLFAGISIMGGKTEEQISKGRWPSELRELILNNSDKFYSKELRDLLLSFVPDDSSQCLTATNALSNFFGIRISNIRKPNYQIYSPILSSEMTTYVENSIVGLYKEFGFNRNLRCLVVTMNHFNNPSFSGDYQLYIVASIIIYYSLFGGERAFNTNTALEACDNRFTRLEIHNATKNLLSSQNYLNHTLLSKK